jgi:DNA-binding NarL/FixJ family response regulator
MKRTTSRREPIRVLVVDDHEVVLTGIRSVLRLIPDVRIVGEVGTAAAAVSEASRLMPDLVLLDIRLPDGSGIDACRDILSRVPGTQVLFLTSYADEDTVLAAVLAGAQGYVLKDIRTGALVDAIRTVAAGKSLLDPMVTKKTMAWLKTMATKGARSKLDILSPQEERMLPLVAQGKTNKEIATAMNLSEKTVKNYLCRVYEKLQVSRRSQVAALYVQHARSRNHSAGRSA